MGLGSGPGRGLSLRMGTGAGRDSGPLTAGVDCVCCYFSRYTDRFPTSQSSVPPLATPCSPGVSFRTDSSDPASISVLTPIR